MKPNLEVVEEILSKEEAERLHRNKVRLRELFRWKQIYETGKEWWKA